MRKITAIPSQKIAFKNVPVSGLFFLKRTLYQKSSVHEANTFNKNKCIFFQPEEVVRFITKMHENIAIEMFENKKQKITENVDFDINNTVDIIEKSILGKVVSINKETCLIQYKDPKLDTVCFDEFSKCDLRKIKM